MNIQNFTGLHPVLAVLVGTLLGMIAGIFVSVVFNFSTFTVALTSFCVGAVVSLLLTRDY